MLDILKGQDDFSNDGLFAALKGYVDEKGYKTGFVMWPVRTAVSGKQNTLEEQRRLWRFSARGISCTYQKRH